MKLIIFFLLALVAVLTLLLLRKYTRLEFVGHARLLLRTWSVRLGTAGALVGVWAQSFPHAALHAGDAATGHQNILPPNIVAMISPAGSAGGALTYVRQPALKDKADEQKEPQQ